MTPFYEVMHTFAVIFIGTSAFLAFMGGVWLVMKEDR
jgi:hypothetical protein